MPEMRPSCQSLSEAVVRAARAPSNKSAESQFRNRDTLRLGCVGTKWTAGPS